MNRVGIDVGGTFTDLVLVDSSGELTLWKTPSTPEDPARACIDGVSTLVHKGGLGPGDVDLVLHGTTIATNIVLEHRGAKAGLITTRGFRDILHIARHKRPLNYSISQALPWQQYPLAPRFLRLPVSERITPPDGSVLIPLNEDDVRAAARVFAENEVEAVSVCFLFSFLNPEHELRAAEILQKELPGVYLSLSHQVIPTYREYERFSTTALNSYVGPRVSRYLASFAGGLRNIGVKAEINLMQSNGGVLSLPAASQKPVSLLLSGLAGGLMGGIYTARLDGFSSVITLDMGGTSADIGVAPAGKPRLKHLLDSKVGGYDVMLPMLDIDTIGAGGGSIAHIDSGGMFRVGPQSAGAVPGPAAYGRGGVQPTVTDANLVLGRLQVDDFLGGNMTLDRDKACAAVRQYVAEPLGISVEEAALGILTIVNHSMAQTIEVNSIRKGYDPRDFALVAFGGAGPLQACDIAALLRIPKVIVPVGPGITSALGLLVSDVKHQVAQTVFYRLQDISPAELAERFAALEQQVTEQVLRDGIDASGTSTLREVDCRYVGQGYELRVPFPGGPITEESLQRLAEAYHRLHDKEYGCSFPDTPIELINLISIGVGLVEDIAWKMLEEKGAGPGAAPAGQTVAIFRGNGEPRPYKTPCYHRSHLSGGHVLEGPAIVTQLDSTTVIPPGCTGRVSRTGNIIIDVPCAEA